MKKIFTVGEVHTLLPVLESLMIRAQQAELKAEVLTAELHALRQRIFLNGGLQVDVADVAQQSAQHAVATEEVKTTVSEIEAIGAKVHDLGEGLLDLPTRMDGRELLLCWRVGEPAAAHWHEEGNTSGERLPLDGHFERGDRRRLN